MRERFWVFIVPVSFLQKNVNKFPTKVLVFFFLYQSSELGSFSGTMTETGVWQPVSPLRCEKAFKNRRELLLIFYENRNIFSQKFQ